MKLPSPGFAAALGVAVALAAPARAADPFLRHTATVDAVQKAGPSVVNVTTERLVAAQSPFGSFGNDPLFDRFFQDFFEPRVPQTAQSLGSGVLVDAERHVLTNEHVVARASRIRVSLADGREFDASLVGADPNNDLAVLRVETQEKLPWLAPGSSGDLMVGEPVIAIGNPFGLSNSVTTGVLSAVDRSIRAEDRVYHGFLQTDASINPGNSGGPLLNAEGRLVGINTAIYGGAQGIGFAIPVDVAKRVMEELIAHGAVAPVSLGFEVQDVDARLGEALALPRGASGALVSQVHEGGPGAAAGVRKGDLLTRLDGMAVRSARDFYEVLEHVTVGQPVRIELLQGGSTRTVSAVARGLGPDAVAELAEQLLGLRLKAEPRAGFVVVSVRPGSGSARIGLAPGDFVLAINGRALESAEALQRAVLGLRGLPRAVLVVQRGSGRYHVPIPLS